MRAGCRTGDIASLEGDPPYWRIVGRASVDIIKSRGYKISAPQIEDVILAHPGIAECAVMGAPDEALGEAVAAVIACKSKQASYLVTGMTQRHCCNLMQALHSTSAAVLSISEAFVLGATNRLVPSSLWCDWESCCLPPFTQRQPSLYGKAVSKA